MEHQFLFRIRLQSARNLHDDDVPLARFALLRDDGLCSPQALLFVQLHLPRKGLGTGGCPEVGQTKFLLHQCGVVLTTASRGGAQRQPGTMPATFSPGHFISENLNPKLYLI